MSEVRVIRPEQRDTSTAQTPGMERAEGCGAATTGASKLWVGHVHVGEGVRSGPHHHGETESAPLEFGCGADFGHVADHSPGHWGSVQPRLAADEERGIRRGLRSARSPWLAQHEIET